jgi:hypothetical protein
MHAAPGRWAPTTALRASCPGRSRRPVGFCIVFGLYLFTLFSPGTADGAVFATFTLSDTPATRAMWDHAFTLRYTVTLAADALTTTLAVENPGAAPFDFTALLHTYLRARAASDVTVSGLAGLTYTDKLRAGAAGVEDRPLVPITAGIDRCVRSPLVSMARQRQRDPLPSLLASVYAGALAAHTVAHVGASRPRVPSDHSSAKTLRDVLVAKANLPDTGASC